MDSIDIYRNSSIIKLRQVPKKICSWITIGVISSILFVLLSITFKYKKYLNYDAYVRNNFVEFYVDKEFFDKKNNDKVIIQNEEYKYTVIAFEEYTYNLGEPEYWKVVIDVNIPDKWIIENNQLTLRFLKKETTLFKEIIEKIKKGMEQ